jgi:hypothetical protein
VSSGPVSSESIEVVAEWELRGAWQILEDRRLDWQTQNVARTALRSLSEESGGLAAWLQWWGSPQLAGRFPSMLALSALHWATRGTSSQGEAAVRQELQRTVVEALWRQVEAEGELEPGLGGRPTDTAAIARGVAAAATAQITSTSGSRDFHPGIGGSLTAELVRAFVDQTLQAVEAGAPDLLSRVRQSHQTAVTAMSTLRNPRPGVSVSLDSWAEEVQAFVADVNVTAGQQVWTHLRNWLQAQAQKPGSDHAATVAEHSTTAPLSRQGNQFATAGIAEVGQVTGTGVISVGGSAMTAGLMSSEPVEVVTEQEHDAARQILGDQRLDRNARNNAKYRLNQHWSSSPVQSIGSIGSIGLVAWPLWRRSPELVGKFPTMLALAELSWPTEDMGDFWADVVASEMEQTVVEALWRHVEAMTAVEPGLAQGPVDAARIARQVARAVAVQHPPAAIWTYVATGVLMTSRLALAFANRTLQAVAAAAPDLVALSDASHQATFRSCPTSQKQTCQQGIAEGVVRPTGVVRCRHRHHGRATGLDPPAESSSDAGLRD